MGESLFQKFLEEDVADVNEVLTFSGINGLLSGFEAWLARNNYIKQANGYYERWEDQP